MTISGLPGDQTEIVCAKKKKKHLMKRQVSTVLTLGVKGQEEDMFTRGNQSQRSQFSEGGSLLAAALLGKS